MSTNQRSNVINGQVVSDEEKEIYDKLSSFLIDIQEKGEIPIKQAILMGQKRVYYIKGKDLVNYFKEHFEDISNQIKTITKTNIGSAANEKSLQTFFTIFFEKKRNGPHRRLPLAGGTGCGLHQRNRHGGPDSGQPSVRRRLQRTVWHGAHPLNLKTEYNHLIDFII